MAMSPVKLKLQTDLESLQQQLYTLFVVFKETTVTQKAYNLAMFDLNDYRTFALLAGLLILTLLFSALIAY